MGEVRMEAREKRLALGCAALLAAGLASAAPGGRKPNLLIHEKAPIFSNMPTIP